MTKLNAKTKPSFKGKITSVMVNDGDYGQEVVFEWQIQGHPTIKTYVKKFTIGDEQYGQKAFTQLEKVMKQLTKRDIDNHSDLEEEKLIGMVCDLTFGNYEGHDYIASIVPVKSQENSKQSRGIPMKMPADLSQKTNGDISDLNDEIPF